jgi:hypothetical protein
MFAVEETPQLDIVGIVVHGLYGAVQDTLYPIRVEELIVVHEYRVNSTE